MSEVLRPYTEFDSAELAQQLQEAVTANTSMLEARNLHGPLMRYGSDLSLAQEKVEKGQHETQAETLGHYAIIGDSGDVIGSASLYPNLKLSKLHVPIPAGIAQRIHGLIVDYPHATPNVHAWASDNEDVLAKAYAELVSFTKPPTYHPITGAPTSLEPFNSAWTLEPVRSPRDVHEAIVARSGLEKVATRRYDDGEDGWSVPPRGTLYAQLHSEWHSAHGRQKELREGKHSSMVKLAKD